MSAAGIPQVALVMGSSTAGGAYVPAMSDETVIVKGTGTIFLGGPPLVKAATGEDVTRRGPRRRRRPHADLRRRRPRGARRRARAGARPVDRREPQPAAAGPAVGPADARATGRRPGRPLRRRLGRSPPRRSTVREIIARLVDGSRFHEFKPRYGETLVYRVRPPRRLPGRDPRQRRDPVQRVGAQGRPLHRARLRSARSRCVFLQNITGFMVGREYEAGGIAKDGAKLVTAVASAEVPEVHGDHRRQLRRRQLRDGRARVPAALPVDVAERPDQRDGRPAGGPRPVDGPRRLRRATRSATPSRRRSSRPTSARARPYFATARLWDDGVIDPLDTRRVLALGIEAALHAPIPETRFGVFRM